MLRSYVLRYPFILILCLALIKANWIDESIFARHRQPRWIYVRELNPAQNGGNQAAAILGTGPATPTTTTSSPPPIPTTDITSTTGDKTPPPPSPKTPTTSTANSKTTTPPENSPEHPKTSQPPEKTTSDVANTETRTVIPEPSTTIEFITSIVTLSGSVVTSVTSSTLVSSSFADPTDSAPAPSENNNGSASMQSKTKNTVIGVVVGIGGAALLGGLFFMAWRLWGRKKYPDDDNGLMDFHSGKTAYEKAANSGTTRPANPFQSTLETYHNPGRVNASSNF